MRPVRINISEMSYYKFSKFVNLFMEDIIDKTKLKPTYNEWVEKYIHIVLDMDTGCLLQAFTIQGDWTLSAFYYNQIPTSDALEKAMKNAMKGPSIEQEKPQPNKELTFDQNKVDVILDKIAELGPDAITRAELKYLQKCSKLL